MHRIEFLIKLNEETNKRNRTPEKKSEIVALKFQEENISNLKNNIHEKTSFLLIIVWGNKHLAIKEKGNTFKSRRFSQPEGTCKSRSNS